MDLTAAVQELVWIRKLATPDDTKLNPFTAQDDGLTLTRFSGHGVR